MPDDATALESFAEPGGPDAGDEAPAPTSRILVIDDERNHAEAMGESLEAAGQRVVVATTGSAGIRQLKLHPFDLVVTDLKMRDVDGLEILKAAKVLQPEVEVILVTGHGDVKSAVEAMREGAYDFIEKPVDLADLRNKVEKALERGYHVRRIRELERLVDERYGLEGIVGDSPPIRRVTDEVRTIGPTNVTVLITGEPGTGKELIGKAIHNNSARSKQRYVTVNCANLRGDLLQSELFGHVKGAFTGADKEREGKFEYANGGTLFLDELGEMPLETQAMLLRVLEEKTITRIGANTPRKVDVRVIAATNRDLEAAIAAGQFRQDLYSRFSAFTVHLPPLRERPGDIPLLAQHFLKRYADEHEKPQVDGFSPEALRELARQNYPSNVRDLQNLVQRCVLFARGTVIGRDEVQQQLQHTPYVRALEGVTLELPDDEPMNLSKLFGVTIAEAERALIRNTLKHYDGNRKLSAQALGIAERTLYRKLNEMKPNGQT